MGHLHSSTLFYSLSRFTRNMLRLGLNQSLRKSILFLFIICGLFYNSSYSREMNIDEFDRVEFNSIWKNSNNSSELETNLIIFSDWLQSQGINVDNYDKMDWKQSIAFHKFNEYLDSECVYEKKNREIFEGLVKQFAFMMDTQECNTISSCEGDATQNTFTGLSLCDNSSLTIGATASGGMQVGMVFGGWTIPENAIITDAYIQFTASSGSSGAAAFQVYGEASDNANLFSNMEDVFSRIQTSNNVNWSPATWASAGDAGLAQRTPDLSDIIQEIIDRPGYVEGNNIGLIISGTGRRDAEAFDSDATSAPELCISYELPVQSPSTCAECPDISIVSLDGIPNFPEVDLLNLCSSPDTLTLLIYNGGECDIFDIDMTITFDEGLSYGGFITPNALNPGTGTVTEFDLSDLTVPVFRITQIDSSAAYIVDIAMQADCDVNIESEEDINLDASVSFTYNNDNGSTPTCTETITEVGAYNSGIKVPVLNALSISPSTRNISASNTPQCQRVTISQDGIDALLDEFVFQVQGIDQSVYEVASIDVNDILVPPTDYSYDPMTQQLSMTITNTYFTGNQNGNGDNFFDTDERLFVDVCYQVTGCTDQANFLNYEAFYGCNNKICGDITQIEGAVDFKPNYGASVNATNNLIQYGGICGDNLIFEFEVSSNNTNPLDGIWEDMFVKFNACIGGNVNLAALTMDGLNLPPEIVSTSGATVVIDFRELTSDIDGAGGLSDFDGDGLFDDLPGGDTLRFYVELEIGCADNANCSALSCSITSVEINGKRNCGQDFQEFESFPTPISYFYGEQDQFDNEIDSVGDCCGRPITEDFRFTRSDPTCSLWHPMKEGFYYSYLFGQENITPCAGGGDVYLEVTVTTNGTDRIPFIRYEEGSATYEGSPVPGVTWEYETVMLQNGDLDSVAVKIRIPAGDASNIDFEDYHWNLELMRECFPSDYMFTNVRVVEECTGCVGTDPCEIIRSCHQMWSYIRWSGCSCQCYFRTDVDTLYRLDYGYADASLTQPLTIDDVPEVDRTRFLPGDRVFVRNEYEALPGSDEFTTKADHLWQFFMYHNGYNAPLIADRQSMTIEGIYYEAAGGTRELVELPDCMKVPIGSAEDIGQYHYRRMTVYNGGIDRMNPNWTTHYAGAGNNDNCQNDPNENPTYSTDFVNYARHDQSIQDWYDYNRTYIALYWENAGPSCGTNESYDDEGCFEEWYAKYPFAPGDKFYIEYTVNMMHNPNYDLLMMNPGATNYGQSETFSGAFNLYQANEDQCTNVYLAGSCNSTRPYQGHIPGPVVVTDTVTVEDCDTDVEYTFTLTNPVPTPGMGETPWYENEYRPFMYTDYLEPNFPANMVYLNDGTIVMPDGSEIPIPQQYVDDDYGNLNCVNDGSGGICCVAEDSTQLAALRINDQDFYDGINILYPAGPDSPSESGSPCDDRPLIHDNLDPFPALLVTGDNFTSTYGLKYSLSSLCPEDIESTDFVMRAQFSEPYVPSLPGEAGGPFRTSALAGCGPGCLYNYPYSHINLFPNNPFTEYNFPWDGVTDGTGNNPTYYYWQNIVPNPEVSQGDKNPMRQTTNKQVTPDNFVDNSMDFPPLLPEIQNLLKADLAGQNETNVYTLCAGDAVGGGATHQNIVTSVEVPNSIEFIGAEDSGGNPLSSSLVSTTPTHKIYAIVVPGLTLAPGDCYEYTIITELLFCPIGVPELDTRVCATSVSGCLDPAKAAVLSVAGNACDIVDACYEYIREESDLQVEWDPQPMGEYGLCDNIPMGVRLKNVKPALLIELDLDWWFPAGLDFVPGSWQVCYPGGPTNTGPCVSIPDPTADPTDNSIFGTNFGYDEDAIWSMALPNNEIDQNGLKGIGVELNSDSNRVQFLFEVNTDCDEFVSGTRVYHQAFANDPCEQKISSMFVESDPIIIENANPADFAQFFVFAEPTKANCGEDATLTLSYLNIAPFGDTDETTMCVDLETETFDYMPGGFEWISPVGHNPTVTEETNGNISHVCFTVPDGIGPGELFQVGFNFTVPEDIDCGEQPLNIQVQSEIMDQSCMAQGVECSVYVLNSVNPQVDIEFLPPLNVDAQTLTSECPNIDQTVDLCYTIDLSNPGPSYNNDVEVILIRDINLNGILDEVIDEQIASNNHMVNLNNSDSTTLTSCFTVSLAESCPVFMKVMQTTDCVCDALDFYYDSIEPNFLNGIDEITLCPDQSFGIENCVSWDYSVMPAQGANIVPSVDNDSLYITLNDGYGVNTPVVLQVESEMGSCSPFQFDFEINSLEEFSFGPFETQTLCNVGCRDLELGIDEDLLSNATVLWTPSTYLDDPTSISPEICDPLADITYTIEITFDANGIMCQYSAMYSVEVEDQQMVDVFEDGSLCTLEESTFAAPSGFGVYKWTKINPDNSTQVVQFDGNNTLIASEEGDYFVEFSNLGDVCTRRSNIFRVVECPTFEKELTSITPTANINEYTVVYTIDVSSSSVYEVTYDLYDLPGFDDDISISSAAYVSSLGANSVLSLPMPAAPGWTLADDQSIMTGVSHTYTMTFVVSIDLEDGSGDDVYSVCGQGTGANNAVSGEGLYNLATLDLDDDPTNPEATDSDCGELPYIIMNKSHMSTTSTGKNCYDVIYQIDVENIGGAEDTYDLTDNIGFDDDFEVNDLSFTTNAVGLIGGSLDILQTSFVLADDQSISAGKVDTFSIIASVCIDLEDDTSIGDEVYSNSCGDISGNVSDPTSGEGLYNIAELDINNDGTMDLTSEACDDVPYLLFNKELTSSTRLADGTYDLVYSIEVENVGGASTEYDLFDSAAFDDDFEITSASYTYNGSSNVLSTTVPMNGWILASDRLINEFTSHTYTVEINIDYDFNDGTVGDDSYSACGSGTGAPSPGEGLYNAASIDWENDGDIDSMSISCEDLRIVDVALRKTIATAAPYSYDQEITFEIEVINQGSEILTDIELTDYLPCGFEYTGGSQPWQESGDNYTTVISGPINIGSSEIVTLTATLVPCTSEGNAFFNLVEVSDMYDEDGDNVNNEDVDSTPDQDPNNDSGGNPDDSTDDEVDGDGTGDHTDPIEDEDPDRDEDDHDGAEIAVCDLALVNILEVINDPISLSDTAKFQIVIRNQGNRTAQNVAVNYYIPNGLEYLPMNDSSTPSWTEVNSGLANVISDEVLTPGISDTICIYLRVNNLPTDEVTSESWTTVAEITGFEDGNGQSKTDDIDSTPDSDPTNDPGGNPEDDTNDEEDGNGSGDPNDPVEDGDPDKDEDDHDSEKVKVCDAASIVELVSTGEVSYGDTLKYIVKVYNQGNDGITNVLLNGEIGSGLEYLPGMNDALGWSEISEGSLSVELTNAILPGDSSDVCIYLEVLQSTDSDYDTWLVNTEIERYEDPNDPGVSKSDIDSTPDDDLDNDSGGNPEDDTDDETDGDGSGDPNDPLEDEDPDKDEDDQDVEDVAICDVSLVNKLSEIDSPLELGDTVKYIVVIENQGNRDIEDVEVVYHIPNGFNYLLINELPEHGWSSDALGSRVTMDGVLRPGSRDTVCIYLEVEHLGTDEVTADSWTTIAEVTQFLDDEGLVKTADADSTPDNDPTNDPGGNPEDDTNDEEDGDGSGDPNDPTEDSDPDKDEDDHDSEKVKVCDAASIVELVSTGEVSYGDTLKYIVKVYNQGNDGITNVLLNGEIGSGLEYLPGMNDALGWSEVSEGSLSVELTNAILPGDSSDVCIYLEVLQSTDSDYDTWLINTEIERYEDPNDPGVSKSDIDSTPDDDLDNDSGGNPEDDTDDETDGDGSGDPNDPLEDEDPDKDEDDQDVEDVAICDVSLVNKLSEIDSPLELGDTVKYIVVLENQGNRDIEDVEVLYHIPNGFNYLLINELPEHGWSSDALGSRVTMDGVLRPGSRDTVCIYLELEHLGTDEVTADSWTTIAEVTQFLDDEGLVKTADIDSVSDEDPTNDPGGNPEDDTNDEEDGDGSGDPNDPLEDSDPDKDEDDHDSERIGVCDASVIVYTEASAPHYYGDTIKYVIEVYNQGNDTITNISLQNIKGEGLDFIDHVDHTASGWVETSDTELNVLLEEELGPGDTSRLCVYVEVVADEEVDVNSWEMNVEITSFELPSSPGVSKSDIDSTPDEDPDNDSGGNAEDDTNDETDGDGSGDPNDPLEDEDPDKDEDDQDVEEIKVYDLALIVQIDSMPPVLPVVPGDVIKFRIVLDNQGNTSASGIGLVSHMMPENLSLASHVGNSDWSSVSSSEHVMTYGGPLASGLRDTVCVYYEVVGGAMADIIIWSEITGSTEYGPDCQDADSVYDNDNTNDSGGNANDATDDEYYGDGSGDPTDPVEDSDPDKDEDDHDVAPLDAFDLALKLYHEETTPISLGQEIKYTLELYNQGNFGADSIDIVLYVPTGLELSGHAMNAGWEEVGPGKLMLDYDELLGDHDSTSMCVYMETLIGSSAEDYLLYAEVSYAEDIFDRDMSNLDIDSSYDMDNGNDSGGRPSSGYEQGSALGTNGEDNQIFEAGIIDEDEDDHDPAWVPVMDLATIITVPQIQPVLSGDDVTFCIEVHNQGNLAVGTYRLEDYIPSGFMLSPVDTNGWALVGDSTISLEVDDTLLPGDTSQLKLQLRVLDKVTVLQLVDEVEITYVEDTTGRDMTLLDIDSTPDGDEDNDVGGNPYDDTNDELEESSLDGVDEDDHDPAAPPVLDIALKVETPTDTPVEIGDTVKFTISLYNQGNVDVTNMDITNYIPTGLSYIGHVGNAGWAHTVGDSTAVYTYSDTLGRFSTDTICLYMEVNATATPKTVVNMAEVSYIEDTLGNDISDRDIDSESDDSNGNDKGNDLYSEEDNKLDEFGRYGEDEDDHDQAFVNMCGEMAAHGQVNISLDETCSGQLQASVLLIGDLYPNKLYTLEIRDEDGNVRPTDVFTVSDLGSRFTVEVCLPLCENICTWSEIVIEDKFAPYFTSCVSDTISCVSPLSSALLPEVGDNCGAELVLVDQVYEKIACDSLLLGKYIRKYIAVDGYGNVSLDTCTQEVSIRRTDLSGIVFPDQYIGGNALSCNSFASLPNGAPLPSVTGVPSLNGVALYPFNNSVICNGFVDYEDEVKRFNNDCKVRVTRRWKIGEWHCDTIARREIIQYIEIVDKEGPVLVSPPNMEVSVSGHGCSTEVILPAAAVSDNCSEVVEVYVSTGSGVLNSNGGLISLEVGDHNVVYTAKDACGNIGQTEMRVLVRDELEPVALCETYTTVSLQNTGEVWLQASSIDDGSFDGCGSVEISIRRMDDPCGLTGVSFGDEVGFCCSDAGTHQMVVLRVTDSSGNTNECMVEVEVQDKNVPQVVCPSDMTVTCDYTYDSADPSTYFGSATYANTACPGNIVVRDEVTEEDLDNCRTGSVYRRIEFEFNGSLLTSCEQVIEFESTTPLDSNTIEWPLDYTSSIECSEQDLEPGDLPLDYGYPRVPDGVCNLVGIEKQDQRFDFAGNGSCFKIIRTWSVIDWCGNVNSPTIAEYTHEQVLIVNNSTRPLITSADTLVSICSYDANCSSVPIKLTASATDDCTPLEELQWDYVITLEDGSTINGNGNDASGLYPIGRHYVEYEVRDKCGNIERTGYEFEIKNCKAPTAYCLSGLSTALVAMDTQGGDGLPDTEMALIVPSMFDNGSVHDCGYPVVLSFSSDVTDTLRSLSCSELGMYGVELWVTDINGNQSYCSTFIEVIDSNDFDFCIQRQSEVRGRISTSRGEWVSASTVHLEGSEDRVTVTDTLGQYGFDQVDEDSDYMVIPHKDGDDMNGVSTLDLILIQRHILGISKFDNPYDMIAADVNSDERVTASDLVELRKLILGLHSAFPNNTSWRFVDEGHSFGSMTNPWVEELKEDYAIAALSGDMEVDFVGVKIGDVNGDVETGLRVVDELESRTRETYSVRVEDRLVKSGEELELVFAGSTEGLSGYQMEMLLSGLEVKGVSRGGQELTRDSWYVTEEGVLRMVSVEEPGESWEELIRVEVMVEESGRLSDKVRLVSDRLSSEVYEMETLASSSIEIMWEDQEITPGMEVSQNEPNPWITTTSIEIGMPEVGQVVLRVKDVTGKLLLSKDLKLTKGKNMVTIDRDDLPYSGILLYEVEYGDQVVTKKMISLR